MILVAIWRPRLRGRPRGDLRVAIAFGLALGAMNLCIYQAMDRIPLGVAVTFEFIGPLGVAVVGSRRALDLLWVVLAAAGIVLLADYSGGSLDPVGVAFALAAGGLWAAYIVLSQRTGTLFGGGSGLAVAMVAGAALVAPFGIADGRQRAAAARAARRPARGRARVLGAALLVRARGAAAAARARVRRADVARAGGRRAGGPRRARPGAGGARLARDRPRRGRQRGGFYARCGESVESRGGAQPARPRVPARGHMGRVRGGGGRGRVAPAERRRSGAGSDVWAWITPRFNARYVGVVYLGALVPLVIFAVSGRGKRRAGWCCGRSSSSRRRSWS